MTAFGEKLGSFLKGGEIIELVGDVGSGKTTFVKGLAAGLGIRDEVQSPTFTISRVYGARDGLTLAHYDFYRLNNPGILGVELQEALQEQRTIVAVEWGEIVSGVLPSDRLTVKLTAPSEKVRNIKVKSGGDRSKAVVNELKK